ncbi:MULTISPECIES: energy-coupled thiamine transporter ThiT [unclassified Streptococcus]|uniref:energy-coupled thiamine transporter ThiT n=1 Tax=unclassified Streptococcus TaxID=2608887 RepID=UPI0018ABBBD2|nr:MULTISPECIES: energy-coupled thiamine transporter ThiT [unclassified Streptococcus]MBF8970439.1 energy-coupled thiamine transporter ThiT [Streptococcus sp. NLN76]MBG9367222.1 energy-coupled thiamine transporter ThiT [Streptococcus sp. NLN64]MBJ6746195.1 energy-coupled thiamine transporter ThiT [Streptococcus sp. 121]
MSKNLSVLTEAAIFAALAMALSMLPDFASWFTPSFGTIPLLLFSLRRGLKPGLLAGLSWGLLHFLLSRVYYLSLPQVFIEYVLAFLVMGLAGFFAPSFKAALKKGHKSQAIKIATLAAFTAILVRYLFHFWAGILFWSDYAPEGMSPIIYSLSVNGTAGLLTLAFSLLVILPLVHLQPRFFLTD